MSKDNAPIDETGHRYGKLVVTHESFSKVKSVGRYWVCQCDCGNQHTVRGTILRTGASKSCGCDTKRLIRKAKALNEKQRYRANVGRPAGDIRAMHNDLMACRTLTPAEIAACSYQPPVTRAQHLGDKIVNSYHGNGTKVAK